VVAADVADADAEEVVVVVVALSGRDFALVPFALSRLKGTTESTQRAANTSSSLAQRFILLLPQKW